MTAPPKTPAPKSRWPRRLRRLAGLLLAALVLVPVGLYLTRAHTLFPWALARLERAAAEAGWELRAERLAGDPWLLELTGLELRPLELGGQALERLHVARARVELAPMELLRQGLSGLRRIQLEDVRGRLNLAAGGGADEDTSSGGWPDLPLALPEVLVTGLQLELVRDDRELVLERAELSLGPGPSQALRLRVPALRLTTPTVVRQYGLALEGTWRGAHLTDATLTADGTPRLHVGDLDLSQLGAGRASLAADLFLPSGDARLRAALRDGRPRATLVARDLELATLAENLRPWVAELEAVPDPAGRLTLELEGEQQAQGWHLEGRVLGHHLRLGERRPGELEAVGSWSAEGLRLKTLELHGELADITSLGLRIPREALISGRALEGLRGDLRLVSEDLGTWLGAARHERVPAHRLELAGQAADGVLQLEAGGLTLQDGSGFARWSAGRVDLIPDPDGSRAVDLEADLDLPDLSLLGRLLGREDLAGRLTGSLRLRGDLRDPEGTLELAGQQVVLFGQPLDALRLAAHGRGRGATLEQLILERGGQSLALAQPARLTLSGGELELEPLVLEGTGRLRVELAAGGAVDLQAEALDLSPWIGSFAPAGTRARGLTGRVQGSGQAWSAELAASELSVPGWLPPVAASLGASLAEGRLDLERLELRLDGASVLSASGTAPLDLGAAQPWAPGDLDLQARLAWPAGRAVSLPSSLGRLSVEQGAEGELTLGGSWRDLTADLELDAPRLVLDGQALGPAFDGRPLRVDLAARWAQGRLELSRALADGGQHAQASLAGGLELPSDLQALLGGATLWRELPVEGTAQVDLPDLAWVAALSPTLLRTAGAGRLDVRLSGPLGAPAASGTLELRAASLRARGLPPLEALAGTLRLAGRRVELEGLRGELGSGPVKVSGHVDLDGERPLDLSLTGEDALLLRSRDTRLRADAQLRLAGTLREPRLTGTLDLRRARLRSEVDFLGLLRGESRPDSERESLALVLASDGLLARTLVDVRVNTVEPLEVRSNVASGSLRGSLRLEGRGTGLLASGDLFLDASTVSLPGGTLRLTSGLVSFDPASPFAPGLELNGEARLAGYDIQVRITGDLDQPEVDLSSTPPLPVDQVLLLLLTGQVPEEGVGLTAARSLTIYVAKDLLRRWSSSGLEGGESWVDRLEIVTGREVSRSGLSSLEATWRLGSEPEDLDRTWYIVAERDRYEDMNFGMRFVVHLR